MKAAKLTFDPTGLVLSVSVLAAAVAMQIAGNERLAELLIAVVVGGNLIPRTLRPHAPGRDGAAEPESES